MPAGRVDHPLPRPSPPVTNPPPVRPPGQRRQRQGDPSSSGCFLPLPPFPVPLPVSTVASPLLGLLYFPQCSSPHPSIQSSLSLSQSPSVSPPVNPLPSPSETQSLSRRPYGSPRRPPPSVSVSPDTPDPIPRPNFPVLYNFSIRSLTVSSILRPLIGPSLPLGTPPPDGVETGQRGGGGSVGQRGREEDATSLSDSHPTRSP